MFVDPDSSMVSEKGVVTHVDQLKGDANCNIRFIMLLYCAKAEKISNGSIRYCFLDFFILISIFPQIAEWGAKLLGFQAPVNFIFIVVIFLLLVRSFLLTIKISQLEDKIRNLIEELAVRKSLDNKSADNIHT